MLASGYVQRAARGSQESGTGAQVRKQALVPCGEFKMTIKARAVNDKPTTPHPIGPLPPLPKRVEA